MKGRKNQETLATHYITNIGESTHSIAKNTEKMYEKVTNIEQSTKAIERGINPKSSTILSIIAIIITAIGVCIAYLEYRESHVAPSEYNIYLSSEYTKLKVNAETDLTATLNFDTDLISISAYLNSILDGDTLLMTRNNETEWHKKVRFKHIGTYEVIATAIAPNGQTIETSLKIEVIP